MKSGALALMMLLGGSVSPVRGETIAVDGTISYQRWRGWEATAETCHNDCPASWPYYKEALLDQAVNDLGLDRVRLEVLLQDENPQAGLEVAVNDNADPFVINPAGFQWGYIDSAITQIALPMRSRLAARGESLYVTMCYVDFRTSAFEHHADPEEYAEFVLATYQHMQTTYGFVPDGWEIILEPDMAQKELDGLLGATTVITIFYLAARAAGPREAQR